MKIKNFNGVQEIPLRYMHAIPHKKKRGTILILQDYHESLEQYIETAQRLCSRGFHVLTFDWYPQNSSLAEELPVKPSCYRPSLDDHSKTLIKFIENNEIIGRVPSPLYMISHGFGSVMALHKITYLNNLLSRLILIAPLLQPCDIESYISLYRIFKFSHIINQKYSNKDLYEDNIFTHDQTRFLHNVAIRQKLQNFSCPDPSIKGILKLIGVVKQLNTDLLYKKINLPMLFITAGDDQLTNNIETEHIVSRLTAAALINIPGAYHDLLQESDDYQDQFWIAFDHFIPGSKASDLLVDQKIFKMPRLVKRSLV